MPPTPPAPEPVRSAAVINAEIRELAGRIGLSQSERDRMVELWAEWAAAVAREREMGLAA